MAIHGSIVRILEGLSERCTAMKVKASAWSMERQSVHNSTTKVHEFQHQITLWISTQQWSRWCSQNPWRPFHIVKHYLSTLHGTIILIPWV